MFSLFRKQPEKKPAVRFKAEPKRVWTPTFIDIPKKQKKPYNPHEPASITPPDVLRLPFAMGSLEKENDNPQPSEKELAFKLGEQDPTPQKPIVKPVAPSQPVAKVVAPPRPESFDFGLKAFLTTYGSHLSDNLKSKFILVHQLNPTTLNEIATLKDLLIWASQAQRMMDSYVDAQKQLEAIKFRLRIAISLNHLIERSEKKMITISRTPQFKFLEKARQKAEFKKFMLHPNLIKQTQKLLKGAIPNALPIMTCENEYELALKKKLERHKSTYDKRMKLLNNKKVTATMDIEYEAVTVKMTTQEQTPSRLSDKRFSDESVDIPYKAAFRYASKQSQNGGDFIAAFSKRYRELIADEVEAIPALPQPTKTEDQFENFTIQINQKRNTIAQLEDENKKLEASIAGFKKAILTKLNLRCDQDAFDAIHSSLKKPKKIGILNTACQDYIHAKNNDDKTAQDAFLEKAADISLLDRFRMKLGFNPSQKFIARKASVKKYFDLAFAQSHIKQGLRDEDLAPIQLCINAGFFNDALDDVQGLTTSVFKNRFKIQHNTRDIKTHKTELAALIEAEKAFYATLPEEPTPDETTETLSFSWEEETVPTDPCDSTKTPLLPRTQTLTI